MKHGRETCGGPGLCAECTFRSFNPALAAKMEQEEAIMTPSRTASPALCDFTMRMEGGCVLTGYRDTGGVPTIGAGHTGPHVYVGQTISHAQALQLFAQDMQAVAHGVCAMVTAQLTQNQFDAVCDFVYEEGLGQFHGSTLWRMLNVGNMTAAADEFPKWVYGHTPEGVKVVLQDLVNRRAWDRRIFTGEATPPYGP